MLSAAAAASSLFSWGLPHSRRHLLFLMISLLLMASAAASADCLLEKVTKAQCLRSICTHTTFMNQQAAITVISLTATGIKHAPTPAKTLDLHCAHSEGEKAFYIHHRHADTKGGNMKASKFRHERKPGPFMGA